MESFAASTGIEETSDLVAKMVRVVGIASLLAVPIAMLLYDPAAMNAALFAKAVGFRACSAVAFVCASALLALRAVPRPGLIVWLFAAFIGVTAASDFLSLFPTAAIWGEATRYGGLIGSMFFAAYLLSITVLARSRSTWRMVLAAWVASSVIAGISGIGQPKVDWLIGTHVFFGAYLAFGVIFALWSASLAWPGSWWRPLALIAAAFDLVMLGMAHSWSAAFALLVAGSVAMWRVGYKRVVLSIPVVAVAMAYGVTAMSPATWHALDKLRHGMVFRGNCWGQEVGLIREHPVLGWGQDNVRILCRPEMWDRAQNIVLQILLDGGIVALVVYAAFFIVALRKGLRAPGGAYAVAALAAFVVLVGGEPEALTTTVPMLTVMGWIATQGGVTHG